jgi:hypothetical protein
MADSKISQLTGATTPLAGTEVLPIVQSSATVKVSVDNLIAGRALPNLGIGVAPSSWGPLQKAIEYGVVGAGISVNNTNGNMNIASNQYNNGTSTLYASTNPNFLVQFSRSVGALNLYTAPSGTGGTAVTNTLQYQFGNTGDFTLNTGNLVIGTSGKGIDFSATPGTGTSELLADYEEGTWTPTDLSGASLTFTNLSGNCYYTKVGNLVTCIFNITYPATADVNNAYIGGLPFTSKSTTNAVAGGQFSFTNYGAFLSMAVNTGATSFYFWTSAGGLVTNATASGKVFRGVITYMV